MKELDEVKQELEKLGEDLKIISYYCKKNIEKITENAKKLELDTRGLEQDIAEQIKNIGNLATKEQGDSVSEIIIKALLSDEFAEMRNKLIEEVEKVLIERTVKK